MITPEKQCKERTFFPIPEFTDVQLSFGAALETYFNRYDLPEVPREFESAANKLFFRGGTLPKFHPKVGSQLAFRAIQARLSSWASHMRQK